MGLSEQRVLLIAQNTIGKCVISHINNFYVDNAIMNGVFLFGKKVPLFLKRDKKIIKFKVLSRFVLNFLVLPAIFVVCSLIIPLPGSAAVTGVCSTCHTMHNSQNGGQVARGGSGVGWDGSGDLTGGSPSAPMNKLLVSSCVACHTSTTSSTIINLGSSRIPIVYNTVPPATPLAGGNFYWVAQGDDTKGHNVYGIADQDANLNEAPGRNPSAACAGTCHYTLADPPGPGLFPGNMNRGGCQGCHVFTAHHDDSKPWYRFLKGHNDWTPTAENFGDYVTGIEDDDWEFTKSATDHNYYKGSSTAYNSDGTGLLNQKTVSSFCAGCHSIFHNTANISSYPGGVPYTNPWLRHPTDILLPNAGEYSGYNPATDYSAEAPVAWLNPSAPSRTEAVVMCLSCHRPHGSPYPDILRWDYSLMLTGDGGSGGCFTCHTNKN